MVILKYYACQIVSDCQPIGKIMEVLIDLDQWKFRAFERERESKTFFLGKIPENGCQQ